MDWYDKILHIYCLYLAVVTAKVNKILVNLLQDFNKRSHNDSCSMDVDQYLANFYFLSNFVVVSQVKLFNIDLHVTICCHSKITSLLTELRKAAVKI